ncbi:ABC transporter permease [Acanthopleuribacter pedis]|uniref:ABC transporter permease n=1 Tax=Acanthopleuribacter pedis TaxID=442870 RepID=A0A8J7QA64_9BACT|nr:ABC transporter permease [Acanthopleuribacter pedis]MBO1322777.1 ABC transporter permease [Acanthopleuribacter pedis]
MKPAKIVLVAKREYFGQLRHWSFWMVTFGLPVILLMVGIVFFISFIYFVGHELREMNTEQRVPKVVGVVDPGQFLDLSAFEADEQSSGDPKRERVAKFVLEEMNLPAQFRTPFEEIMRLSNELEARYAYQSYPSVEAGEQALRDLEIRAVLFVDPAFRENFHSRLTYLNEEKTFSIPLDPIENQLSRNLIQARFEDAPVDALIEPLKSMETGFVAAQAVAEPESEEQGQADASAETGGASATADGTAEGEESAQEATVMDMGLGIFFASAMLMLVLVSTNRLLMGLVEEKQNRVLEVLLSSMSAEDLMGGKVIGLGAVALTQFGVWSMLGMLPMFMLFHGLDMSLYELVLFFIYFLFGYLLIAIIILGLGSLVSNAQEAGQWTGYLILLFIIPLYAIPFVAREPGTWIETFCTMFPFCSPVMAAFRIGVGTLGLGEAIISLAILGGTMYLSLRLMAKVFRLGILMTGSPPSPMKLVKLLREA